MLGRTFRLCFVAQTFPIQGRATDHSFLWPLARGLVLQGHEVVVLTGRNQMHQEYFVRDGVQVHSVFEGNSELRGLRFEDAVVRKFRELHAEKKIDLVHSLDASGMKIAKLKKRLRFKVAFDVEATHMGQVFAVLGLAQENVRSLLITGVAVLYKFLTTYFGRDRHLLAKADGVFVTTPQQKIFLERYYLFPDARTYLVPYGLELGNLSPHMTPDKKKELGLSEVQQVILTISDFNESESLRHLLLAFEKVALKKNNARMIIVGNGTEWKKVQRQVLDLALGSRVVLTGAQNPDQISSWISACDVYVDLTARTTGFDATLIEAMAQEKLVIGSEVGPIAAVVEEGLDGFLLRPADHESLAQLLIECFSGTIPIGEIGERARQKVLHLFDTKKMVQALISSYARILDLHP